MWLTELNRRVCIELAGTQCGEPCGRRWRRFYSRVLRNENHVLHPLLPERNDHGYELRRRRHDRVLTMPQLGLSYTIFSTSQLYIV